MVEAPLAPSGSGVKGFSPRVQMHSEQIFNELRLKQDRLVQPTPQADLIGDENLDFYLP